MSQNCQKKDFENSQDKEMINDWSDGYTNYPDHYLVYMRWNVTLHFINMCNYYVSEMIPFIQSLRFEVTRARNILLKQIEERLLHYAITETEQASSRLLFQRWRGSQRHSLPFPHQSLAQGYHRCPWRQKVAMPVTLKSPHHHHSPHFLSLFPSPLPI